MKAAQIKLPFGLNEKNILIHISDVESGKKCGCVCPSCKSPLVAAKGNKNQHHFKHAVDVECEKGLESAIHLAAKQIITERKQLTLPECISIVLLTDSRGKEHKEEELVVREGTIVRFDSVREEIGLHGIRADILAMMSSKPLIIEIFYRHKVDDEKFLKIVEAKMSAVEIDLSDLTSDDVKDWDAFWSCINDPNRIHWLYNNKSSNAVYRKLENNLIVKIQKLEKQYQLEESRKQKREEKEKARLAQALEELKALSSNDHISKLTQNAEEHAAWKLHSKYLRISWDELPYFLNADVPHGDWIFGCDKRVWQTAFYSHFIHYHNKPFTIAWVDKWLKTKAECKVPQSAELTGMYGRRYPESIPVETSDNLPSSWGTLRAYFNYLCKLGMLDFSGYDRNHPGSCWFQVMSKTPDAALAQITQRL